MDRSHAIARILEHAGPDDLVLSTTGMISREVFVTDDRARNFYMLGSMGLASALGLGLALLHPQRRVFILEGDGSALMSLGALALVPTESPKNLVHIILDNEAYESTGGQPSISANVDLASVGRSCGYPVVSRVSDPDGLDDALEGCRQGAGPYLIVAKVAIAPVSGIPRVFHSPAEIRDRFKRAIVGPGDPS
jgi:thiamine pyrophosphate-dependent acetolactate synthase large subunit-like protein